MGRLDENSAQPCGCDKGANHLCDWHAAVPRRTTPPLTMPVVYVAGPYRGKDNWEIECNIRRAETLALDVWRAGAAALCPHANTRYFQYAAPDDVWLQGDLAMLRRCDAILMTPDWQRSEGARAEFWFAQDNGIPVFYDVAGLVAWMGPQGVRNGKEQG